MPNSNPDSNASVAQPASAVPLRDHGFPYDSALNSGPFDSVCSQVAAGHLLIAKNLIDAGQLPEAVEAIDRALTNSPRFAAAHFWKGVVLYLLARIDEAHRSLKTASDLDPSMANGWLALAHVQFEQALPETALQSIDKSIAADPKNPRAAHAASRDRALAR